MTVQTSENMAIMA